MPSSPAISWSPSVRGASAPPSEPTNTTQLRPGWAWCVARACQPLALAPRMSTRTPGSGRSPGPRATARSGPWRRGSVPGPPDAQRSAPLSTEAGVACHAGGRAGLRAERAGADERQREQDDDERDPVGRHAASRRWRRCGGRSGSGRWTGRNHAPRVPTCRPPSHASDCTTAVDPGPSLRGPLSLRSAAPAQSAGSGQRSNHCRSGDSEGAKLMEGQVDGAETQGSPRASEFCWRRMTSLLRATQRGFPPHMLRYCGPAPALARRPPRAEHVGGLAVDAVGGVDPELVAHPLVHARPDRRASRTRRPPP